MLTVSDIYVYPIKSLSGVSLKECHVDNTGLRYDRRWVLIDKENNTITQREIPEMALLSVSIEQKGLRVWHRQQNFGDILIPYLPSTNNTQLINIWDDQVLATHVGSTFDAWFEAVLGINARLFYQPESSNRLIDKRYAFENECVSLADGYPVLLIGQASIDDLNSRLASHVSIKRFRPNIVFRGGTPFEEESLYKIRIGSTEMWGVKNCARCPIPNIDPETALITKNTIKTLASYRMRDNKVYFGQNLIIKQSGIIKIGDEIRI